MTTQRESYWPIRFLRARTRCWVRSILASGDFQRFGRRVSHRSEYSRKMKRWRLPDWRWLIFMRTGSISSIKGLRRAVSIDSDEPDYIFNLGQAAARSERYKEAADAYERFLIIAPKTDADRRARIRGLIDFLRYLGKQGSLYVLAGENKTTMPFESVDGRPILKVRVNDGREPLRFVLDTGSGMSVISEETAKKLGLRPVARGGMARAVGGGGKFEIVYGFLDSLDLGGVRVESVEKLSALVATRLARSVRRVTGGVVTGTSKMWTLRESKPMWRRVADCTGRRSPLGVPTRRSGPL